MTKVKTPISCDVHFESWRKNQYFIMFEIRKCSPWILSRAKTSARESKRENFLYKRWFKVHQLMEKRDGKLFFHDDEGDINFRDHLKSGFATYHQYSKNIVCKKEALISEHQKAIASSSKLQLGAIKTPLWFFLFAKGSALYKGASLRWAHTEEVSHEHWANSCRCNRIGWREFHCSCGSNEVASKISFGSWSLRSNKLLEHTCKHTVL